MYESFFAMTQTPFLRNLPVSELYADSDTDEIHNRLLYAAQRQMSIRGTCVTSVL